MCKLLATRLFTGSLLLQATRFVDYISTVPVLVVLTLLALLFPALLFPAHGIGDIRPLDLHFFYSPDQVYAHLAMLGADGRSAYVSMALTSDLVFPVIYAMALSVALMLALRQLLPASSRFRYLCLFPFMTVIADWCENMGLAVVTRTFPGRADGMVRFASAFTSLKWLFIAFTVLLLFTAITCRVARAVRGRRRV
jgi:hypothetical protein